MFRGGKAGLRWGPRGSHHGRWAPLGLPYPARKPRSLASQGAVGFALPLRWAPVNERAEVIHSRQNPLLLRVRAVLAGREPGWMVLEGERLIGDALASGLEVEILLFAEDRPFPAPLAALAPRCRRVAPGLLASVSALKSSPGCLALAPAPAYRPLPPGGPRSLLAVVAGVQDPGNFGAIARVAEAAGASGLVRLGGAQPFGDKALRGSMGSLLRLPVHGPVEPGELAAKGYRLVAAATRGGVDARSFDWSGPVALWIPGEVGGEAPAGAEAVSLPMAGRAESLNVAVAAALLLYAAGRVGADSPAVDRRSTSSTRASARPVSNGSWPASTAACAPTICSRRSIHRTIGRAPNSASAIS